MPKLTEEQLKNWRSVLRIMLGPFAADLASDSMIQSIRDRMQNDIDSRPCNFVLKVKFEENKNLQWEEIDFEPKVVNCSVNRIKEQCRKLLQRHSEILAVKVYDVDSPDLSFVLFKEKQNEHATR